VEIFLGRQTAQGQPKSFWPGRRPLLELSLSGSHARSQPGGYQGKQRRICKMFLFAKPSTPTTHFHRQIMTPNNLAVMNHNRHSYSGGLCVKPPGKRPQLCAGFPRHNACMCKHAHAYFPYANPVGWHMLTCAHIISHIRGNRTRAIKSGDACASPLSIATVEYVR
jgi:hypothetical protein